MVEGHLDKRTVAARASSELARLERAEGPGIESMGVRIRIARLKAGVSQLDMAFAMRAAGFRWTRVRVSLVECGDSLVRVDELDTLAGILECDPVWLMYGDNA